ncbi:MAG: alpha/beta hydrolase [Cyclobacteriaceae bacterium]
MDSINYLEQGSGHTVILIHGFPMNQQVWTNFASRLSESLKVVTIDLPGFGKSPSLPPGFALEDVARIVLDWISEKKYNQPIIIGHSLGGYVTLALVEQDRDMPGGICLFHSTAHADSAEKKQSRGKVLDFIEKQGVQAFTSNFIGQLYADPQHSSITKVKNIAVQSSKETVVGYTRAMRDRKDRTNVLRSFPRPILFLAGEKDQGIPPETIHQQVALTKQAEAEILPEVAHMGMFEAEGACLKKLLDFIEKCAVTL